MTHVLSLPERLRRVAIVSDLMLAGSVHAYKPQKPTGGPKTRFYYHPDKPETSRLVA